MDQATTLENVVKPAITLLDTDCDLLEGLAMSVESRSPGLAAMLLEEIERAEICSAKDLPTDVVTIGSRVSFLDEKASEPRTVQLVLPADADTDTGAISILTPMGAALIGMAEGASITWPYANGQSRVITVSRVTQKP